MLNTLYFRVTYFCSFNIFARYFLWNIKIYFYFTSLVSKITTFFLKYFCTWPATMLIFYILVDRKCVMSSAQFPLLKQINKYHISYLEMFWHVALSFRSVTPQKANTPKGPIIQSNPSLKIKHNDYESHNLQ